jgi:hypothetical protein
LFATQEMIMQIAQPNFTENGIVESSTTYLKMANYTAGFRLLLTVEENYIKVSGKVENRNLANIFNLNVKTIGDPSYSDTIVAKLIIPDTFNVPSRYKDFRVDDVIKATVNCLVKNSIYHEHLDLKISGNRKFSKYEKLYYTAKKKFSIQIKAFQLTEYDEAISYFKSFKDLGLITYLEYGIVDEKEFIRVKMGCFDTKQEASFVGNLLKRIKSIDFFITYFDLPLKRHKKNIKIVNTFSGIWAIDGTKNVELYNFVADKKLDFKLRSFHTTHKNELFIQDGLDEIRVNISEKMRN